MYCSPKNQISLSPIVFTTWVTWFLSLSAICCACSPDRKAACQWSWAGWRTRARRLSSSRARSPASAFWGYSSPALKEEFLVNNNWSWDSQTERLLDTIFPWSVIFSGPMYARQCSKLSTTKAFLTSLTNMWLKGRNGGKGWRNLCGQSSGGRRWGRWCTALPLIARPCEPGARNCSAKYSWWWMPYLWINNLLRQKKGFNSASCTKLEGRCV